MIDVHDLYARYARDLFHFALALSGNRAEAEDLVADAFVRLWTAPGEIREETVRAYLFTIIRNLFRTRRRRGSRHVPLDETLPDPAAGHDERVGAALELARVRTQLASLTEGDRAALVMRGAGGRSYEDIAAALGISPGAARVRVHRARAQLAKSMGKTLGRPS